MDRQLGTTGQQVGGDGRTGEEGKRGRRARGRETWVSGCGGKRERVGAKGKGRCVTPHLFPGLYCG